MKTGSSDIQRRPLVELWHRFAQDACEARSRSRSRKRVAASTVIPPDEPVDTQPQAGGNYARDQRGTVRLDRGDEPYSLSRAYSASCPIRLVSKDDFPYLSRAPTYSIMDLSVEAGTHDWRENAELCWASRNTD